LYFSLDLQSNRVIHTTIRKKEKRKMQMNKKGVIISIIIIIIINNYHSLTATIKMALEQTKNKEFMLLKNCLTRIYFSLVKTLMYVLFLLLILAYVIKIECKKNSISNNNK
jgi:hypothetical protein